MLSKIICEKVIWIKVVSQERVENDKDYKEGVKSLRLQMA
jgi:hypothetical protein